MESNEQIKRLHAAIEDIKNRSQQELTALAEGFPVGTKEFEIDRQRRKTRLGYWNLHIPFATIHDVDIKRVSRFYISLFPDSCAGGFSKDDSSLVEGTSHHKHQDPLGLYRLGLASLRARAAEDNAADTIPTHKSPYQTAA